MIDGYLPGDPAFQLTAANKPAVKQWLIAQGIDPMRIEGMRQESLFKAYRYPVYLRQLQTRRDYCPTGSAAPQENTPCPNVPTDMNQPASAEISRTENGLVPVATTIPTTIGSVTNAAVSSPPTDSTPTTINPTLHATLAALLARVLTEERVIELIREHAPRAILDRLQIGEL